MQQFKSKIYIFFVFLFTQRFEETMTMADSYKLQPKVEIPE